MEDTTTLIWLTSFNGYSKRLPVTPTGKWRTVVSDNENILFLEITYNKRTTDAKKTRHGFLYLRYTVEYVEVITPIISWVPEDQLIIYITTTNKCGE